MYFNGLKVSSSKYYNIIRKNGCKNSVHNSLKPVFKNYYFKFTDLTTIFNKSSLIVSTVYVWDMSQIYPANVRVIL